MVTQTSNVLVCFANSFLISRGSRLRLIRVVKQLLVPVLDDDIAAMSSVARGKRERENNGGDHGCYGHAHQRS